jgi:hypothetical protein
MTNYGLPTDVNFDPSNPDPRVACVLVLDTSGSMKFSPTVLQPHASSSQL